MPVFEIEGDGPDWRLTAERRDGSIHITENGPLEKEAVYATGKRPEAHHHGTDAGDPPVIVFDLHKTLTPSPGFFPYPSGEYLLPPFEGVKENLDRWAGMGVCIHLATASLSPYHSGDVLEARQRIIWGWITTHSLPIAWIEGKVAAHVFYDDRMVNVPPHPDWQKVADLIDAELKGRTELSDAGTLVLVEIPQTGNKVTATPDIERMPPDQPRGLSTEVLSVDFHRCLSAANSSQREDDMKPGAVECVNQLYDMGFQIDLSCAGWDPTTHTSEESDDRLATLRLQARQNGVKYDRFVSKDHATVFVDDKGLKHTDWAKDFPTLVRLMSTPAPEDEITRDSGPAASEIDKAYRPQTKAAPAHHLISSAIDHYTPKVQKALLFGLDPKKVARGFRAILPKSYKAIADNPVLTATALAYAQSLNLQPAEMESILVAVYVEGYLIGGHQAQLLMEGIGIDASMADRLLFEVGKIDWSKWTPGNAQAAEELAGKVSGPGLRELLRQAEVTIKAIQDTSLERLADALAEGAANGDSVDTIADSIRDLLDNPDRAELIANTELNRAVSSASMDTYRLNGVEKKSWGTFNPCDICEMNGGDGAIDLEDEFSSGDLQPPAHPGCRCDIEPALASDEERVMKARTMELTLLTKMIERLDAPRDEDRFTKALEAMKAASERPIEITVQPAEVHIHEGAVKVEHHIDAGAVQVTHNATSSGEVEITGSDGRTTTIRRS